MNQLAASKVYSAFFLTICLVFTASVYAQEDDIFGIERKIRSRKSENELGNVFRNMVSNFSFEISGGGSFHQNNLNFNSETPGQYPIYPTLQENTLDLNREDTVSFSSSQFAFPLGVGARVNVFDFLSLGVGYGREWGRIDPFKTPAYEFRMDHGRYTFDKFYGSVGIILYDANKRISFLKWRYRKFSSGNHYMQSELKLRARQEFPWRYVLEGEFGSLFIRESYDKLLTAPDPYYAVGLRVEREFSEYTKLFVRPAVELRNLQYENVDLMEMQPIRQLLYTVHVGVGLRLPGTKRCKVPGCAVVMKHIHNGVEYRGSSIWKRQHRKIGQWYGN
ncbi:hypothetical protein [Negadavirga shengliensis]|uniref:Inverse autotransporter beta-domain domain-containing protein n=1 Tax=Negadavirga shengliensis TaxID=1389218 RepID=A0ABV9T015_9BACT